MVPSTALLHKKCFLIDCQATSRTHSPVTNSQIRCLFTANLSSCACASACLDCFQLLIGCQATARIPVKQTQAEFARLSYIRRDGSNYCITDSSSTDTLLPL
uniref:(northern house mosquito) hypothetical protein n=1 Tax=Culex pipiens TaxID=7175 RepID=A0A8D8BXQ5_CULPI